MEKLTTNNNDSKNLTKANSVKEFQVKETEIDALEKKVAALESKVNLNFIIFMIYQVLLLLVFWFSKMI